MGNVLSAGLGQAPARQAAIGAGLPTHVEATTVNKVCGSGMQAAIFAHDMLAAGSTDDNVEFSDFLEFLEDARKNAGLKNRFVDLDVAGVAVTERTLPACLDRRGGGVIGQRGGGDSGEQKFLHMADSLEFWFWTVVLARDVRCGPTKKKVS